MSDDTTVPATPVVAIEIADAVVRVNGQVVDHGPDANLYEVGVHAAAQRVAQVLGRPVRAVATVDGERAEMVVHPDGTVTGVLALGGPADVGEDTAPLQLLDPAERAAESPRPRPRSAGRPVPRSAWYVLAAAMVAAVVVWAGLELLRSSGSPTPTAAHPSAQPRATASPSSRPARHRPPPRRLGSVRVSSPAVGVVDFQVTVSHHPARVRVQLTGQGATAPTQRTVRVTSTTGTVTLHDVSPGTATWTVRVLGPHPEGKARRGHVEVRAPQASQTASADATSSSTSSTTSSSSTTHSTHHSHHTSHQAPSGGDSNDGPVKSGGGGGGHHHGPVR